MLENDSAENESNNPFAIDTLENNNSSTNIVNSNNDSSSNSKINIFSKERFKSKFIGQNSKFVFGFYYLLY
ncbi:MAG: hypothetical protein R2771_06750 [Saprospiraceae bacterium]